MVKPRVKVKDMTAVENRIDHGEERLAVKTICASDILKNIVSVAEELQQHRKKISRYIRQASLILTWKRSSGVMKMAGSVAKTVGSVIVVAAPMHPKFALATGVAHKLWKLGTSLKILNAIGGMLKDIWQAGCRNTLIEFTHCTALLTKNLGVLSEVIQDLQGTAQSMNHNNVQAPQELVDALRPFIPAHQINYATHIISIAFGSSYYSPLFDFISLTSSASSDSQVVQLMQEIESFHFTEFVEYSDSKALVAIGSFLHITKELVDFLDGFQSVTDRDCRFLQDCLTKFTEESLTIMRIVSVLTNLDQIKRQQITDSVWPVQETRNSLYDTRHSLDLEGGKAQSVSHAVENNTEVDNGNRSCQESKNGVKIVSSNASNPLESDNDNKFNIENARCDGEEIENGEVGNEALLSGISERHKIIENSHILITRTFSSFSSAVSRGTTLVSAAVKSVRSRGKESTPGTSESFDQFTDGNDYANRI